MADFFQNLEWYEAVIIRFGVIALAFMLYYMLDKLVPFRGTEKLLESQQTE